MNTEASAGPGAAPRGIQTTVTDEMGRIRKVTVITSFMEPQTLKWQPRFVRVDFIRIQKARS